MSIALKPTTARRSFTRLYYQLKPVLPSSIRIGARRIWARRKRVAHQNVWPINEAAARPPAGWTGWPERKKFAFVLTHDVEGAKGLQRCRRLMDMDAEGGFRSSFNFIPESGYSVPASLRRELTDRGFEVGVHDLRHDGKLYWSRPRFRSQAQIINRYIKDWGAVGFRSGFMHHNLEWLHDLNILYDSSTFDTDPFEPQPDGVQTIFPFWVDNPNGRSSGRNGYVELPYTLPQDFTLFVLLQEKSIEIWKRKLDWVAARGGMVLLDVHPDYLNFNGNSSVLGEFPARLYQEFLDHVRTKYQGMYWQPLPREVGELIASRHRAGLNGEGSEPVPKRRVGRKIWIDLDNTPHIPFFKPIIRELETRGHEVVLTAREAFQVCELAEKHGLKYRKIGRHYGKNPVMKVLGLVYRAFQLLPFVLREKPALGLSHGARSQMFICNLLRIPTVLLLDYEHCKSPPLARPAWEIVPDAVAEESLFCSRERVRKYSGIKEDVYVPEFQPDPSILKELGLTSEEIIVTVRPPATEAHYHNPASEVLFQRFMDHICQTPGVQTVLLPRNKKQEMELRKQWPHWFTHSKVVVPAMVVDGLNLLWHSDLVVSGGGTMNREAAALGLPVYSIFLGKTGAVDRRLQEEGRLILITKVEDIAGKMALKHRKRNLVAAASARPALTQIVDHIEDIISMPGND